MSCPVCGAKPVPAVRPFCSKRCADLDLGRWLKGAYVVPGQDGEAADDVPSHPDGAGGASAGEE